MKVNVLNHGIDSRENDQEQRMFANLENPSIFPVSSLVIHLSKLSNRCDSLLFPKEKVWYAAQPVRKN